MTEDDAYRSRTSGVKVSEHWVSSEHYCNRVSQVTVFGPGNSGSDPRFVEFGWVGGYSNCDGSYMHRPRLFIWFSYAGDGTQMYCMVAPGVTPTLDAFHEFILSNADESNTIWTTFIGGNNVGSLDVSGDFVEGTPYLTSERSNAGDSAFASFKGMREHHTSGGWSFFDNLISSVVDNDPGYDANIVTNSWGKVQ